MERYSILDQLSRGVRSYVLLFLLTFITSAPGVFTMPALDRDESRFAQASKQMLETGDYIKIRYQDGMRNKKPAGIHWLQAGSTAVFSSKEAKQIWSYRLPSFIGGALATCALFWAGIPLIGRRAAFVGAALFATGILLTSEAHISKTDGVLVAITTLGVGALAYLRFGATRPRAMALLFWFAMGFGFLIKGPVTPMVAFLAVIFFCLWSRRDLKWPGILSTGLVLVFLDNYLNFGPADQIVGILMKGLGGLIIFAAVGRFYLYERKEGWFRNLIWLPGPLLWVAMVLPWFLSIQIATDGEFFQGAVGKDLKDKVVGASEGHGGAPGYHILYLLSHFFPATLFLIPGIVSAVKDIRAKLPDASGLMFIVSWIIPTWVIFEFLPTKLSHYVLPAYPALALLCGYGVIRLVDGVRLPVSRYASLGVFLVGGGIIALLGSPLAIHYTMNEAAHDFKTVPAETVLAAWSVFQAISWPYIFVFAFFIVTAWQVVARRYQTAVIFALLCSMSLGWHARITFLPVQTWLQATTVAREALADVCGLPGQKECAFGEPTEVQAIGYAEPSFVFTTGTEVKISPESTSDLPPASEAPLMVYVINLEDKKLGVSSLEAVRAQAREQGRCIRESKSHYALNYSNGDPVHFIALAVDPGPCQA